MKITFNEAKKKLATTWFVAAGIIFILMFLQTLGGKFDPYANEAWGWLFANILPSLTLIITVFVADIKISKAKDKKVDSFYYRLVFYISLFYFSTMLFLILLQPLLSSNGIIEVMKKSSIYLGPFQGIVSGAMGLFFVKKED